MAILRVDFQVDDDLAAHARTPSEVADGETPAGFPSQRLKISPIGLRAANAFVGQEHRHHPPTRGHKFSIAVRDEGGVVRGVAIAGRPVSRLLDDGEHLEVTRVATDGCPNACSALYGACARAGVALGYARHNILTYILESEPGTSLKAAGWVRDGMTEGGTWNRPSRRREDNAPLDRKIRWRAAPQDRQP